MGKSRKFWPFFFSLKAVWSPALATCSRISKSSCSFWAMLASSSATLWAWSNLCQHGRHGLGKPYASANPLGITSQLQAQIASNCKDHHRLRSMIEDNLNGLKILGFWTSSFASCLNSRAALKSGVARTGFFAISINLSTFSIDSKGCLWN